MKEKTGYHSAQPSGSAQKRGRIDYHYETPGTQAGRTKQPRRLVFEEEATAQTAQTVQNGAQAAAGYSDGATQSSAVRPAQSAAEQRAAEQQRRAQAALRHAAATRGYEPAEESWRPPAFEPRTAPLAPQRQQETDSAARRETRGGSARQRDAAQIPPNRRSQNTAHGIPQPQRDANKKELPCQKNQNPKKKRRGLFGKKKANRAVSSSGQIPVVQADSLDAQDATKKTQRTPRKQAKLRTPRQISYEQAKRRKVLRRICTGVLVLAVVALGVWVSMKVLFKISNVTIEGESVYPQEQILAAFGHNVGDSLFSFDAKTATQMEEALPYLETVTIRRRLPGTVAISFTQAQETYTLNTASGWAVLSAQFKILRLDAQPPAGLILLLGAEVPAPAVGQALALADSEQQEALTALCGALNAEELAPITSVDVTNVMELSCLYDSRVEIILGTTGELAEKLEWSKYLLLPGEHQSIGAAEQGTLDVSTRNANGRLQGVWRAGAIL